jgi:hypothetical protein
VKNSTVGYAGTVKEITRLSENGYMNIHLSNAIMYLYLSEKPGQWQRSGFF